MGSATASRHLGGDTSRVLVSPWRILLRFVAIAVVVLLLASSRLYSWFRMETEFGVGLMPGRFPEAMGEQLTRESGNHESSNVVVFPLHIGYGNYFLWRGYPHVRSFIDGRLEVHDTVYATYREILADLETAPARALGRLRAAGVTHVAVHYPASVLSPGRGPAAEFGIMAMLWRQPDVALRFVDGSGALFSLAKAPAIDPHCVGLENEWARDLLEPRPAGLLRGLSRWLKPSPSRDSLVRLRAAAMLLNIFHAPQAALRQLIAANADNPNDTLLWASLTEAYSRLATSAAEFDPWTADRRYAQARHARDVLGTLTPQAVARATANIADHRSLEIGALQAAVARFEAFQYLSTRGELSPLLSEKQLTDVDRYRARWLLALVALDLGDRDELHLQLQVLMAKPPPEGCTGIRALAEKELERLERSCTSAIRFSLSHAFASS